MPGSITLLTGTPMSLIAQNHAGVQYLIIFFCACKSSQNSKEILNREHNTQGSIFIYFTVLPPGFFNQLGSSTLYDTYYEKGD